MSPSQLCSMHFTPHNCIGTSRARTLNSSIVWYLS